MSGEQLSLFFEGFEEAAEYRTPKPKPGEVGFWPYPKPCPWRGQCINYTHHQKHGGGCSGEHAICDRGQLAAGRVMPEWRWNLMSPHARHYLKGVVLGDPKELKAFKRYERSIERMYEQ